MAFKFNFRKVTAQIRIINGKAACEVCGKPPTLLFKALADTSRDQEPGFGLACSVECAYEFRLAKGCPPVPLSVMYE